MRLTPMHPGVADEELSTWYYAKVSANADVPRAMATLRAHPRVLAAYPKPPDEMPMG
jgi:hypothetical protein